MNATVKAIATVIPLLLLRTPAAAVPATWTGKVVEVADGDTITVLHDGARVKIRLQGVDAPEKAQPFGDKATQLTSTLVLNQEVRVQLVARDRYGRTLARVSYLGKVHRNPLDRSRPHQVITVYRSLEESLLQAGLAWWFRKYSTDNKLGQLEQEARKAHRGLWADAKPTPPWLWRHPDLVCEKDADCVFVPSVCPRCAPCRPTPRRVGNTRRLKQIESTRAGARSYRAHPSPPVGHKRSAPHSSEAPPLRARCAPRQCPPCASEANWISGKPVCTHGLCALERKRAQVPVAPTPASPSHAQFTGLYHGNVKSKVLHAPGCPDHACKRCTAGFKTVDEARRAGYRAHRCVPPFETCYGPCLKQNMARATAWEAVEARCRHRCERR